MPWTSISSKILPSNSIILLESCIVEVNLFSLICSVKSILLSRCMIALSHVPKPILYSKWDPFWAHPLMLGKVHRWDMVSYYRLYGEIYARLSVGMHYFGKRYVARQKWGLYLSAQSFSVYCFDKATCIQRCASTEEFPRFIFG